MSKEISKNKEFERLKRKIEQAYYDRCIKGIEEETTRVKKEYQELFGKELDAPVISPLRVLEILKEELNKTN